MLYIFHGEDDFSAKEALATLKQSLGPSDMLSTNTTVLAGQDLTFEHLANVCNTIPFLAEKRLVIVEGLLNRWESREKRRGLRKPSPPQKGPELGEWEGLAEMAKTLPESTVLVLKEGLISRDNPMLKALSAVATSRAFVPPKGGTLQQWIRVRVAEQKGQISPAAVRLLAEISGGSLWVLAGEIEKLCLYANGRAIEERDVQSLVANAKESSIFALIDGIIEGKTAKACRELHRLMDSGAGASYILAMLVRQLRMMVLAKELGRKKVPAAEMGGQLGTSSEFAIGKAVDQAATFTEDSLKEAYERVLAADVSIKTGELSEGLALELLAMDLAQQSRW